VAKAKTAAVRVWTKSEEQLMVKLVKSGTPTSQIAKKLKRSAASVRSKAQKRSLSLKARAARSR